MSDFQTSARAATKTMRALFPATPLLRNDHLSAKYDADIWLKREDLSPVRSYKIRGAFNALTKARAREPAPDVFVCASAGNHAQGVAYVCQHLGVRGVIFMPITTPQQKVQKTKIFGGDAIEVILTGDYFDDTLAAAKAYCHAQGAHFLSPFDDDDVIEGQASVSVEIADQLGGTPDMVILPVGGGGLSAGATAFFGSDGPALHYVEPQGAASLHAAIQTGAPQTLASVDNFVDGASVARIGDKTFAHLNAVRPHQLHQVSEDRLCTTIVEMLNIEGIVLEPAGALSIDLLADLKETIAGKTVVCVSSGGNFDFERLPEVKERAQRYLGLKKYFILRLPQRPGALRDFLAMLGPDDDIARFEYLKKSARNFGTVLIGIETSDAGNFAALDTRLSEAGFALRDITDDASLADFLI